MKSKIKNKKVVIVGVVVIAVLSGVIWFAQSSSTPKVNGENAIYEFDGTKVGTTEYYSLLKNGKATNYLYAVLEKEYLSSLETSTDLREEAALRAKQIRENYDEAGSLKLLDTSLRQYGYRGTDELELYSENALKGQEIVYANAASTFTDFGVFSILYKPRVVSHVVVLVAEGATLTDDQKLLMEKVDNAIAGGTDFRTSTQALSDGTTIVAEDLGYVDSSFAGENSSTRLDTAFLDKALETQDGEISEWTRSAFGYHRIYVSSTQEKDIKVYDTYVSRLLTFDTSLQQKIMINSMEKAGVVISPEVKKEIYAFYNIKESE